MKNSTIRNRIKILNWDIILKKAGIIVKKLYLSYNMIDFNKRRGGILVGAYI